MYVKKTHKQRFVSAPLRALLFATFMVLFAALAIGSQPVEAQSAGEGQSPGTPTMTESTALWTGKVDVEWTEVSGAESYQLQLWLDRFSRWKNLPTDGIEVAYYGAGAIVRALPGSDSYWFRVRALNAHGASNWSAFLFVPMTGGSTAWIEVPEPVNSSATGTPSISGILLVDQTLTVDGE